MAKISVGDMRLAAPYVTQQRLAADFVQHLGPARFEARPFSRGHNTDREL